MNLTLTKTKDGILANLVSDDGKVFCKLLHGELEGQAFMLMERVGGSLNDAVTPSLEDKPIASISDRRPVGILEELEADLDREDQRYAEELVNDIFRNYPSISTSPGKCARHPLMIGANCADCGGKPVRTVETLK